MNIYVHYGHTEFDKNLFTKVRNEIFPQVKPIGGFWASPIDAKFGWKEWCESSGFRSCNKENSFEFSLKENANVFHIRSMSDLIKLPQYKCNDKFLNDFWYCIDFEKCIEMNIDAIELHLSEDNGILLDSSLYYKLYGWDCDSILIINQDVIVI